MLTKRYIVIFAGLGPEKFTEDVLIRTWEDVADRIYLETGIYISARLATLRFCLTSCPSWICSHAIKQSGPIPHTESISRRTPY